MDEEDLQNYGFLGRHFGEIGNVNFEDICENEKENCYYS